jgi:hypothetical protein
VTTEADYQAHEWQALIEAPLKAGLYVLTADPNITGMLAEMRALDGALRQPDVEPAAAELVAAISQTLAAKREANDASAAPTGAPRESIAADLGDAVALVRTTGSEAEGAAFAGWLLGIAAAVARASREGGFLGIGGTEVSQRERIALDELQARLT